MISILADVVWSAQDLSLQGRDTIQSAGARMMTIFRTHIDGHPSRRKSVERAWKKRSFPDRPP